MKRASGKHGSDRSKLTKKELLENLAGKDEDIGELVRSGSTLQFEHGTLLKKYAELEEKASFLREERDTLRKDLSSLKEQVQGELDEYEKEVTYLKGQVDALLIALQVSKRDANNTQPFEVRYHANK